MKILQVPHLIKTRKPHVCHGCLEMFLKGTQMMSGTYVDGGEIYTIHECLDCVKHTSGCEYCRERLENGEAVEGYVYECIKNS